MKTVLLIVALLTGTVTHARDHEEKLAAAQERMREAASAVAAIVKDSVRRHDWRPDRAFLGIMIGDQGEDGLRVAGVSPDGGAEAAGLQADDLIIAINDESLRGEEHPVHALHGVLEDVDPGDSVILQVIRDGEEHRFTVATSPFSWTEKLPLHWLDDHWHERFNAAPIAIRRRFRDEDGLQLVDIGEDLGAYFGVDAGVLVVDTPAKSELKPGDILKRIDDTAVSSAADAYRLLRHVDEDEQAEVQVRRKDRKVTVSVAPMDRRGMAVFLRRGHGDDEVEEEEVVITIESELDEDR